MLKNFRRMRRINLEFQPVQSDKYIKNDKNRQDFKSQFQYESGSVITNHDKTGHCYTGRDWIQENQVCLSTGPGV